MEISLYNTLMYPIPLCRHLLSPLACPLHQKSCLCFIHLLSPSQEAQPLPLTPVYLHRKPHTQSLEHLHQKYQKHH